MKEKRGDLKSLVIIVLLALIFYTNKKDYISIKLSIKIPKRNKIIKNINRFFKKEIIIHFPEIKKKTTKKKPKIKSVFNNLLLKSKQLDQKVLAGILKGKTHVTTIIKNKQKNHRNLRKGFLGCLEKVEKLFPQYIKKKQELKQKEKKDVQTNTLYNIEKIKKQLGEIKLKKPKEKIKAEEIQKQEKAKEQEEIKKGKEEGSKEEFIKKTFFVKPKEEIEHKEHKLIEDKSSKIRIEDKQKLLIKKKKRKKETIKKKQRLEKLIRLRQEEKKKELIKKQKQEEQEIKQAIKQQHLEGIKKHKEFLLKEKEKKKKERLFKLREEEKRKEITKKQRQEEKRLKNIEFKKKLYSVKNHSLLNKIQRKFVRDVPLEMVEKDLSEHKMEKQK